MGEAWQPGPAWLFCPADRPDRYIKALDAADVVILDLEDAVPPDRRPVARQALRDLVAEGSFARDRTVVRINGADSPEHVTDTALLQDISLARVMLAKAEQVASVSALDCQVIPLIETVRGVENASAMAAADNVVAMMWGADDLVASLGGTSSRFPDGRYRDVARHARVRVLMAAKAADRLALDAVFMDLENAAGLTAECKDAVASGFDATVAIHPRQVPIIRDAYQPDAEQIDWARRLLAAVRNQTGVTTFEGRMVDGPIYRQAQRILRLAPQEARDE